MQRRKFLIGAGSLAAGTAGAIGTGAFTSVSADRSVSVNVATDDDALLAFDDSGAENGGYVEYASNGEVSVDITESPWDGSASGLNPNSRTIMFDLFKVRNQGTQAVAVWVDPDSVETASGGQIDFGDDNQADIYLDPQASDRPYGNYDSDTQHRDEISLTGLYEHYADLPYYSDDPSLGDHPAGGDGWNEFKLLPGDSFNFGLWINAPDNSFNEDISMTVKADADKV